MSAIFLNRTVCKSFRYSRCKICKCYNKVKFINTEILESYIGRWKEHVTERFCDTKTGLRRHYDGKRYVVENVTEYGPVKVKSYTRVYPNVKIGVQKHFYECRCCGQKYSYQEEKMPLEDLSGKKSVSYEEDPDDEF